MLLHIPSVPYLKGWGRYFFIYSQPCSIPFVLCGISTKGLESRMEKSAAGSPWEKGSPAAAVLAQPAVPHPQLSPLQHTGWTKVMMLTVLLTWGWDSQPSKDCSWCQVAKPLPSSPESGTTKSLLSPCLDARIMHAPTSHRLMQEFFLIELINCRRAWLYLCLQYGASYREGSFKFFLLLFF